MTSTKVYFVEEPRTNQDIKEIKNEHPNKLLLITIILKF